MTFRLSLLLLLTPLVLNAQSTKELLTQGVEYMNAGKYEAADEALTNALKQDANLLDARLERGKLYAIHLKKGDEAVQDLVKCQMGFHRTQEAHYYAGKALMLQQKPKDAAYHYGMALMALLPGPIDRTQILFGRGIAYLEAKDYKMAISDLDGVVKASSGSWNAYYYRGLAKKGSNNYKGAEQDMTKALSLVPNDDYKAMVLLNRGDVYKAQGNTTGACKDYIASEQLGNFIASNRAANCVGSKRYAEQQRTEKLRNSGSIFTGKDHCSFIHQYIQASHTYFDGYRGAQRPVIMEEVKEYDLKGSFPQAIAAKVEDSYYLGALVEMVFFHKAKTWEPVKASWNDLAQMVENCLIRNGYSWNEKKEEYQEEEDQGKITWYLPHPEDSSGWYHIRVIVKFGRGLSSGYDLSFMIINGKKRE